MTKKLKNKASLAIALLLLGGSGAALAGDWEMGTGIPEFAVYSSLVKPPYGQISVLSLASPSINFPAGCTELTITPFTLGGTSFAGFVMMDTYKLALATLLEANVTSKRVRFSLSAGKGHDSVMLGCDVDHVQLVN